MRDDVSVESTLVLVLVLVVFAIGLGLGAWAANTNTHERLYKEAFEAGCGDYKVDPQTGKAEWYWKGLPQEGKK